jgi:hypothetical protein
MIVIDYNGKTVFEIVVDHTPRRQIKLYATAARRYFMGQFKSCEGQNGER